MKTIKALLFLSLVLSSLTSQSKNYYISSSGKDANSGLTPATAWQTIAKLNASFSTISAGDSILFKRGDVFYGTIQISKSGTIGNLITIGTYGVGARPVISGFKTIASWTLVSGNTYKSTITGSSVASLLTIDGTGCEKGRFPNTGWNTYSAYSGTTSITDASLIAGTNWAGAKIVIRKSGYKMEKVICTTANTSNGMLSYRADKTINPRQTGAPTAQMVTPAIVGFGYIITDDARTLDTYKEWHHDTATSTLKVVFDGAGPGGHTVKFCNRDTLININTRSNITVDGIAFEGGNVCAVYYESTSNISIKNCTITNAGSRGIFGWNTSNLAISNVDIYDCLSASIDHQGRYRSNATITNCTIKRNGLFNAQSCWGDNSDASAIYVSVDSFARVSNNYLDSSAYSGVNWGGSKVNVDSNFVFNTCLTRDDNGSIYTFGNPSGYLKYGNKIRYNIIGGNHGAPGGNGYGPKAAGIYGDGAVSVGSAGAGGMEIAYNTIYDIEGRAIYNNNPKNVFIHHNTVYNSIAFAVNKHFTDSVVNYRNTNNIYFNTIDIPSNVIEGVAFNEGLNSTTVPVSATMQVFLQNMGVIDSNIYQFATSKTAPFKWYYYNNYGGTPTFSTPVNFTTWKSYTGQDLHSTQWSDTTIATQIFAVASGASKTVNFPGLRKKDVYGNIYNDYAIIPPFQCKVLLWDGVGKSNIPPVANAANDKLINLPTNYTSLSGSGTDIDGSISNYVWVKIAGPSSGTITIANTANTIVTGLVIGVYQYELTVTDNNGGKGRDTVQVTVSVPVNLLPSANAGDNKIVTLPANTTILTGTGTDGDGTIIGFSWVKISGPSGGVITTPHTANTAVNNLKLGVYCYELTVTDNAGATDKDTITIQVTADLIVKANRPPVANAGSDQIINLPINFTTLSGSGIDPDGSISSYTWSKISGPSVGDIANFEYATTTVRNLVKGVYQFGLTVTDDEGATSKDTVKIAVNAAVIVNHLPNAHAGNDVSILLPVRAVSLTGIGTDNDGTIAAYQWKVVSGPAGYTVETPNSTNANLNNLFQGVYEVEFEVIDNAGGKTKDTLKVIVSGQRASAITSNEIKIYPNPVRDIANLNIFAVNKIGKIRISVADMKGVVIKSNELLSSDNTTLYKLNMSNLTNGNYIITVRFEDGQILSSMALKHNGQ